MKIKLSITAFALFFCLQAVAQEEVDKDVRTEKDLEVKATKEELEKDRAKGDVEIVFERPFNAFISAGISHRMGRNYNVAISPVDNVVQFESVTSLNSGVATGLVWNPFTVLYKISEPNDKDIDWHYKYKRHPFAIALLVNLFKLSYSNDQSYTTSPIDVGFGLGYRSEKLLILVTGEFTPIRQPRKYFIDSYKGQNKQLILAGSQEPARTISPDDNSIFITRLYPALGLKIAYSFGAGKEKE
ncbi:hypothetical protein I0P70_13665 [Pontibacter sp. FD36]|uniref:hypothetical protein n=1 Tax=Pontibacter sp. FD36 TaxID=2789860 RepID=UPI0018A94DE9|nr:hypothetical protein [Pontibacter sp. FD36]MBF8964297.1 hypothetical protein [Pontibacter sp. FD36]